MVIGVVRLKPDTTCVNLLEPLLELHARVRERVVAATERQARRDAGGGRSR
jgi:hypothetical protein